MRDGAKAGRGWAVAGVLCAAVVSAGCALGPSAASPTPRASSADPAGTAGGPAAGGTLTVAVSSDFPTLDPALAQDTESISAVQLMYEPLFSYGPGGVVVGRLARAWHWNQDGTTLTVDLASGAHFADGTPVTAADVAFSLERMLAEPAGTSHSLSFSALVGFDELSAGKPWLTTGIQQLGASVIVFHLQRPVPYLPELLALPSAAVVERRLVSGAATNPSWWRQHSAGSGPYVLAASTPGTSLELKPATDYWRAGVTVGGLPEGPFASVEFRIVSSPAQQLRLFGAGRLDVLTPVAPQQIAGLTPPPPGSHLWQGSDLGLAYLGFNVAKPPFDDPRMRQAVAYALNKQALLTGAGGQGQLAGGLLPPGIQGYDPALAPYPYDPAKARALFAQAGGKPGLAVQLLTISAGGTVQQATTDAAATSIARDLDAIGFQVAVQQESWQDYYRDRAAGKANLFQAQWLADYPDPQDFMFNLLDTVAIGAGNGSFFSSPAFDVAQAQAAALLDHAARAAAYRKLDDQMAAALPILPEFYTDSAVLAQAWVRPQAYGVFLAPPLLPQLDRVWVLAHGTA